MEELKELRVRINAIDKQIAELFKERMEVSAGIARAKVSAGLPVYDPVREQEKIEEGRNSMPEEYADIYVDFLQAMMDASKAYQKKVQNEL